jgi:hypothetical protein
VKKVQRSSDIVAEATQLKSGDGYPPLDGSFFPSYAGLESSPIQQAAFLQFIDPDSAPTTPLGVAHRLTLGRASVAGFTGNTGSAGNMTCLLSRDRRSVSRALLIDLGLTKARIRDAFRSHGLQVVSEKVTPQQRTEISASSTKISLRDCLVTHFHGDHFSEGGAHFCIENGITVHCDSNALTEFFLNNQDATSLPKRRLKAALEQLERNGLLEDFPVGTSKRIGPYFVISERALHDVLPSSYLILSNSVSVFFSGDTGEYSPNMRALVQQANVWLADGNYDPELLDRASVPSKVTTRNNGPLGHMGNTENAGLIQEISMSAASHNLQLMVFLHRSAVTNHQEAARILQPMENAWSFDYSGRCGPAFTVAKTGPQFLFLATERKELILPKETDSSAILTTTFGEPGLALRAGRDVADQPKREFQKRILQIKSQLLASGSSPNQLLLSPEARIKWRVPFRSAVAISEVGDWLRGLTEVLFITDPVSGQGSLYFGGKSAPLDSRISQIAEEILHQLPHYRGIAKVGAGEIIFPVRLIPDEITTVLERAEEGALHQVAQVSKPFPATQIRWRYSGDMVLIASDVYLPAHALRILKPRVAVSYYRNSKKLIIQPGSTTAMRENFRVERVQLLRDYLESMYKAQKATTKFDWKIETDRRGIVALKHTKELKLEKGQDISDIADRAAQILLWGEV